MILTSIARAYRLLDDDGQLIAELLEVEGSWFAWARWGESMTLGPYPSSREAAAAAESAWTSRGCPRQVLPLRRRQA